MLVFMFPDQGSQRLGMGGGLFDSVAEFRKEEAAIDKRLDCSIREWCTSAPDLLAGRSLGEYAASVAGRAFGLLTGLRLVQERGRLMSLAKNGAMATVIGMDAPRADRSHRGLQRFGRARRGQLQRPGMGSRPGPGGRDTPRRIGIREVRGLGRCTSRRECGLHSRHMKSAAIEHECLLGRFEFSALTFPVGTRQSELAV